MFIYFGAESLYLHYVLGTIFNLNINLLNTPLRFGFLFLNFFHYMMLNKYRPIHADTQIHIYIFCKYNKCIVTNNNGETWGLYETKIVYLVF